MPPQANPNAGCCTVETACCPNEFLCRLTARWANAANCPGLDGLSNVLAYDPATKTWKNDEIAVCGGVYRMGLQCNSSLGNRFVLSIDTPSGNCQILFADFLATSTDCDKPQIVFEGLPVSSFPGCTCCSSDGTVNITIS